VHLPGVALLFAQNRPPFVHISSSRICLKKAENVYVPVSNTSVGGGRGGPVVGHPPRSNDELGWRIAIRNREKVGGGMVAGWGLILRGLGSLIDVGRDLECQLLVVYFFQGMVCVFDRQS
jgi:hypothetical protein